MTIFNCPIPTCDYATDDVDNGVAVAMLTIHNNIHVQPAAPATGPNRQAPRFERPKVSRGSSEETWNAFVTRWNMFKRGTNLTPADTVKHLFECCDTDLGDAVIKGTPASVEGTEAVLLAAIKQLAVTPVAISVRRAELLATKQDHGEGARAYYAKLKGKAATCSYSVTCSAVQCTQVNDFTDVMVKDVLAAGLVDDEIKREVLGWAELDEKNASETVSFIEAKEMARDALNKSSISGVSLYKAKARADAKPKTKVSCKSCKVEIDRFTWNKRHGKMIECNLCFPCWRSANPRRGKSTKEKKPDDDQKDETNE